MTKPIALFDIDNTIYDGFSFFGVLEKQVSEGILAPQTLAKTKAILQTYTSGQQDYEASVVELLDAYAKGLEGKSYMAILASTKHFYRDSQKFFPYFKPTIKELRATHDIALVTGEPQFVGEAVTELFGLHSYCSTTYEISGGLFTGRVKSHLASRYEKLEAIAHLMQGHGAAHSFAFGDSEGDIEMLRAVQHPICLNATEGLQAIAGKEQWYTPQIDDVAALVKKLSVADRS